MMFRDTFRRFVRIGLFLAAIGFITQNMGYMSRWFCDFTGLGLLILFALTYLPVKHAGEDNGEPDEAEPPTGRSLEPSRYWPAIFIALLFVVSSLPMLTLDGVAQLLGPALFLCGLDWILRRNGSMNRELPLLLMTVFLYALFLILYTYIPQVSSLMQEFSLFFSKLAGDIVGKDISLGISYSGLLLVALFATCYLGMFALSEKKRPLIFVGMLLLLLVAEAVYMIVWAFAAKTVPPSGTTTTMTYRIDFRLLLFLLLLLPTAFYVKPYQTRYTPVRAGRGRVKYAALAAVGLLLLSLLVLTVSLPGSGRPGEVVFYGKSSLDWNLPEFDNYNLKQVGMFGLLPIYLQERGYTTEIVDELTPATLENADTLVLINLGETFDAETKQVIWDFVAAGGSLLTLGDHTGVEHIREPYNDLLQPVHISYNFDSAIPLKDFWERGFELWPHPTLRGIGEDEVQINIGASLDVSYPARPVITGKNGFSDPGDMQNIQNGYLGDMTFTAGEQLGDQVLVAESSYGKGKVLAFGDTTAFQNLSISHSYRFLDNTFSWLAGGKGEFYPYNIILALVLLAASLVFLFLKVDLSTLTLFALTALLAITAAVSPIASAVRVADSGILEGEVANIDISHIERLKLDVATPESIAGLTANLLRNDYTPLLLSDFTPERVKGGDVLVVVAPAKPFSAAEVACVKGFADAGGLLILTVGWEESAAAEALLDAFGMSVANVPLGRITAEQNTAGVTMWEAWPLQYESAQDTEPLVLVWGYPVVVFRQYGQGGVLVAGDSSFLLNRNLEEVTAYNEPNILFLKQCLDRFREGWFAGE